MAIIEVVKFNGSPNVFAWKFPNEELGTWTQLIVNESQEAILYKGGQALDLFAAGRHTLETANIPILNKIVNLPFGGKSPFTAEIWYVNKAHVLDIKWGTPTPIQLQDPKYKVFIPVRSHGQFGIQIDDSRKFLTKIVGTMAVFDKDTILKHFRGLYLTKVKDAISTYLIKENISVLEINAYLDELSEYLKDRILPALGEYGIRLVNFYVNDISISEDDSSVKKLKDALAKKAEMDIVGYNYIQERSFDTLEGAASNSGSAQSGLMGAGIGLGLGAGIGNSFGNQVSGVTQVMNTKQTNLCTKCNTEIDIDKRFCASCGFETNSKTITNIEELTTVCSKCNHTFSKKSKFCPECGMPYNPCVYCGADMPEGALLCPQCSKRIPKPCPKCGTSLDADKHKFCPECGESLAIRCGKCSVLIDGAPKFCPECGNKL